MTATNRWNRDGRVSENVRLLAKLILTHKATGSGATAAVDDYYEFDCIETGLPSFADASTWNVVTDNASEVTGTTYVGKPENMEPIELKIEAPLPMIYGELLEHQKAGDYFTIEYSYDDPLQPSIYKLEVPLCKIAGIAVESGEKNAGSTATIKLQPRGGDEENMPTLTTTARSSASSST